MDVFGLGLKIQEEGAATVTAAMKRLGAELAATALTVGTVTIALNKFIAETSESEYAQAQLNAVLKSTASISGQTADGLNAQAKSLESVTEFGDDAIVRMQSLLLTFTNIRGEIYTNAVPAVLNMASALGQDLQGASIQVGKALNDPIAGVSALGRAGVQFTASQKELIKTFVETNRLADAQSIILKELQTQFGGAAEAARNTLGGALKSLDVAIGNLFELGDTSAIVAGLNGVTDAVRTLGDNLDTVKKTGEGLLAVLVGIAASKVVTWLAAAAAEATSLAAIFGSSAVATAGIVGVFSALVGMLTKFVAFIGGPFTLAVAAVVGFFQWMFNQLDEINEIYDNIEKSEAAQRERNRAFLERRKREREEAEQQRKDELRKAAEAERERIKALIEYNKVLPPLERNVRQLTQIETQLRAELDRAGTAITRKTEIINQLNGISELFTEIAERAKPAGDTVEIFGRQVVVASNNMKQRRADFMQGVAERLRSTESLKKLKPIAPPVTPTYDMEDARSRIGAAIDPYYSAVQDEADRLRTTVNDILSRDLRTGIYAGLGKGLEDGFRAALQTGKIKSFSDVLAQTLQGAIANAITRYIKNGLKTLWDDVGKGMIRGLANQMATFAKTSAVFAKLMTAIKTMLSWGNGIGALVAAAALLAFANANGGSASGGSSVSMGGSPTLGYTANGNAALPSQQIIFGATSATTAAGMTPRSSTNVTIIGPNDPTAQRALQELMAKADSRGRLG